MSDNSGKQGPPPGPPYPATGAVFGGIPAVTPDDIVSSILLVLFLSSAIAHISFMIRNVRRNIKFVFSAMMTALCGLRCVALGMRIAWAANPHNLNIAIAANILTQAGSVLIFIVNLIFSQRILRAYHPRFGWSPFVSLSFNFCLASIVLCLLLVIAFTIQSFFTLDSHMRLIDHVVQLAAGTYLAILAFLPLPILGFAWLGPSHLPQPESQLDVEDYPAVGSNDEKRDLPQHGQTGYVKDKFGSGRWRTKIYLLIFASSVATLGAAFRIGTNFESRPASNPGWARSKPCFYVFNFVTDLLVSTIYLFMRFDKRFVVPDGAAGPGDYSKKDLVQGVLVPEPEAPLVAAADGAASPNPAAIKDDSASTGGFSIASEPAESNMATIIALQRTGTNISQARRSNRPNKKSTRSKPSRRGPPEVTAEDLSEKNIAEPHFAPSRQMPIRSYDGTGHDPTRDESVRTTGVNSDSSATINGLHHDNGQLDGDDTHEQPRRQAGPERGSNHGAFTVDGELLFPPQNTSSAPASPRTSIVVDPAAIETLDRNRPRSNTTGWAYSQVYIMGLDGITSDSTLIEGSEKAPESREDNKSNEESNLSPGYGEAPISRDPSGLSLKRMKEPIQWLILGHNDRSNNSTPRPDASASTDSISQGQVGQMEKFRPVHTPRSLPIPMPARHSSLHHNLNDASLSEGFRVPINPVRRATTTTGTDSKLKPDVPMSDVSKPFRSQRRFALAPSSSSSSSSINSAAATVATNTTWGRTETISSPLGPNSPNASRRIYMRSQPSVPPRRTREQKGWEEEKEQRIREYQPLERGMELYRRRGESSSGSSGRESSSPLRRRPNFFIRLVPFAEAAELSSSSRDRGEYKDGGDDYLNDNTPSSDSESDSKKRKDRTRTF